VSSRQARRARQAAAAKGGTSSGLKPGGLLATIHDVSMATSRAEYAERELLDRRLAEGGRTDSRAAAVGRVLAAIDAAGRHVLVDMDSDGIAAAILDLEETRRLARRVRDEIRMHADEARRLSKPFAYIAADLEKLIGPEAA